MLRLVVWTEHVFVKTVLNFLCVVYLSTDTTRMIIALRWAAEWPVAVAETGRMNATKTPPR